MLYIPDRNEYLRHIYYKCHCVNAGQSQIERRAKCHLLKALDCNGQRMRDWNNSHIARYLRIDKIEWIKMVKFEIRMEKKAKKA